MGYTREQRLDIGRQIVTHQLTRAEAMEKYHVSDTTVDNYIHMYKIANGIPTKDTASPSPVKIKPLKSTETLDIEAYRAMSKEELIRELILAKANELRAKKGYEVKGDGSNKEYIPLNNKNMK